MLNNQTIFRNQILSQIKEIISEQTSINPEMITETTPLSQFNDLNIVNIFIELESRFNDCEEIIYEEDNILLMTIGSLINSIENLYIAKKVGLV